MTFRHSRLRRSAFTLIEVIASIAIAGGVIVGLLVARARASRAHLAAERTMTCARLCADRAAALRAGLIAGGDEDFPAPSGYHWRVEPATLPEDAPPGLVGYRITVMPAGGSPEEFATAVLWLPDRASEGTRP